MYHRFYHNISRLKSISLLLVIVFASCLTPIDFPVEIAGGRLVVSGQISTLADQNIIQLGTTANTYRLPFPVSEASVLLWDDAGDSFSYVEDSSNPGIYFLPGFSGIPGRTYHIELTLANGKNYTSSPETMPNAIPIDSAYYEIVNENVIDEEGISIRHNYLKLFVNYTLSTTHQAFLKWGVQEAYILSPTDFPDPFGSIPPPCFVTQNADPQRVVLFDESSVTASAVTRQLVCSRIIDWTFLEKHYLTTYQSSITKESYEYWRKVNILANQVGSIFDTPPAEMTGNITSSTNPSERPLGFFYACNQSFRRSAIYQSDLPFPLLVQKCDFDGNWDPNHYPPRCIDCTSIRNSSYTRPIWF